MLLFDRTDQLADIPVPVLMLSGAADPLLPENLADYQRMGGVARSGGVPALAGSARITRARASASSPRWSRSRSSADSESTSCATPGGAPQC